jgi:regulator of protease activity HflC (stomatin/prohibitin superfamily)
MQAMELQMAAERTKRAVIIKSEGERERAVNQAQGEAQSRLIDAKSLAEAVKLGADAEASKLEMEAKGAALALSAIADTLGGNKDDAARFQLMREYIAAQRDLATSPNSKVIVASGSAEDVFAKAIAFFQASDSRQ